LANKALLPLPGGNVIQHVMRAMGEVPANVRALLTDPASADILRPVAASVGFEVFPGPEEDVLARYCLASRAFDVQRIIRVTGDNPLTCPRLARDILEYHARRGADLSHFLRLPWGSGVEVVEAEALFAAERAAALPDEREHITTYLYRHPERFMIQEPAAPAFADMPEARVTVDTPEDFIFVTGIFNALYAGAPIEADRVVGWLRLHGAAQMPREARGGRLDG
jgi:spore coat polysaccharide biosynthesis protein SpsF